MKYSVLHSNSWNSWNTQLIHEVFEFWKSQKKKIESHGLALKPVLNLSFLDWLWILGSFCITKAYQVLIYPSLSVCRWWISVSGLFLHKSSFIPNSIQFVQRGGDTMLRWSSDRFLLWVVSNQFFSSKLQSFKKSGNVKTKRDRGNMSRISQTSEMMRSWTGVGLALARGRIKTHKNGNVFCSFQSLLNIAQ